MHPSPATILRMISVVSIVGLLTLTPGATIAPDIPYYRRHRPIPQPRKNPNSRTRNNP